MLKINELFSSLDFYILLFKKFILMIKYILHNPLKKIKDDVKGKYDLKYAFKKAAHGLRYL